MSEVTAGRRRAPLAPAAATIIRGSMRPMMGVVGRTPVAGPLLLQASRPALNASLSALSPVPPETRTTGVRESLPTGQVRGEWVHESGRFGGAVPDPSSGRSIIYYLHGSGYLVCSARTHRGMVARLARRSGIGAFSLDYRLGPRYRFPAGGDDAIRGYRWLLQQGFSGDQIIVAGDSAGGHLAQDLVLANHLEGLAQPAAMVLFSPLYDPTFALACTQERSGVRDPFLNAAAAARLLRLYTGGAAADDPRMRVRLTADMTLPDTLIQYGGREVMGADARAVHDSLVAAGGRSTIQSWPRQGHVFQMFPRLSPDAAEATGAARDFIDRYLR